MRVCIHSRRPHGPRRGGGDTERRQEERLGQARPRIHAQVQATVNSECFWVKKAGAKISRKVVDSNKNKTITKKKKKKKKTCGRPVWSSAQRKKGKICFLKPLHHVHWDHSALSHPPSGGGRERQLRHGLRGEAHEGQGGAGRTKGSCCRYCAFEWFLFLFLGEPGSRPRVHWDDGEVCSGAAR